MSKLGLGAAQLGQDYGIANTIGRPTDQDACALLAAAWAGGVRVLDTAPAYGDSELRIAACRPPDAHFRIVTKTLHGTAPRDLRANLEASLARLAVPAVHGLLLHDATALSSADASDWVVALQQVQEAGLVARVGISIYRAAQARDALSMGLDLIQVPLNVLDQRLLVDGTLADLRAAGFEIHARSVFLQGLLLQSPEAVVVPGAREAVAALRVWCEREACTPLEAAVGFACGLAEVDVVLVGADDVAQLRAILASADRTFDRDATASLRIEDERVLDPSQWSLS